MSKREVVKFNYAIGNNPSMADHYSVFKQIKAQAALIKEECEELQTAAFHEDMTEILDAVMDIRYLNTYLEHMLYAFGCNVDKSWEEVCQNNSSKITTSLTYAQLSKEFLESKGTHCYVEDVVFEGETIYCVKRQEDGKVMKLLNHKKPNLEQYVLEEFK